MPWKPLSIKIKKTASQINAYDNAYEYKRMSIIYCTKHTEGIRKSMPQVTGKFSKVLI